METNSLVELAKPPFDWSMAALIGVGIAFVGTYAWLAFSGSAFLS